jgi:hypothetical protein
VVYQLALQSFMQAARICETFRTQHGRTLPPEDLEGLQGVARAAAQNATACHLLVRGVPPSLGVHWDFTHHPTMAVLALKRSEAGKK